MSDKTMKMRVKFKHDTEANWKLATNFIPLAGETIIYDPDSTHPTARTKTGDGTTKVNELEFSALPIAQMIEVGSDGQTAPSGALAAGGLFFKKV